MVFQRYLPRPGLNALTESLFIAVLLMIVVFFAALDSRLINAREAFH